MTTPKNQVKSKATTKNLQKKTETYSFQQIEDAIYSIGTPLRQGCYDMDMDVYFIGLEHYLKTKQNVLEEYDLIIWASWDKHDYSISEIYDPKTISLLFNEGFWNADSILEKKELEIIRDKILSKKSSKEVILSVKQIKGEKE